MFVRVWVLFLLGLIVFAAPEPTPTGSSTVVAFLEENCLSCHTGKRAKAQLDLAGKRTHAMWRKVRARLAKGEMPPEGSTRPPATEIRDVVAWIDARFKPVTGRVAMRRLNRVEYGNTIRDLLRVDFDASASFPADDVGHGFDNIGDVLSFPPLLAEKYLGGGYLVAGVTQATR